MQALLKRHLDTFDQLRDTQVQLSLSADETQVCSSRPFANICENGKNILPAERAGRQTDQDQAPGQTGRRLLRRSKELEQKDLHYAANALLLRMVMRPLRARSGCVTKSIRRITKSIHRTRIAFKQFRYMVEIPGAGLAAS